MKGHRTTVVMVVTLGVMGVGGCVRPPHDQSTGPEARPADPSATGIQGTPGRHRTLSQEPHHPPPSPERDRFSSTPTASTGSGPTSPSSSAPEARAITIGGPTLDNDYPNVGLKYLPLPGSNRCGYIKNDDWAGHAATVPVTITSIDAVDQTPAGSAEFSTGSGGADCADYLSHATADLAGARVVDHCVGTTLPPWGQRAGKVVCAMRIQVRGRTGTDYSAHVRVGASARCVDAAGAPCGDPEVAALRPSRDRAVTVRWAQVSQDPWLACFASAEDTTPQYRDHCGSLPSAGNR